VDSQLTHTDLHCLCTLTPSLQNRKSPLVNPDGLSYPQLCCIQCCAILTILSSLCHTLDHTHNSICVPVSMMTMDHRSNGTCVSVSSDHTCNSIRTCLDDAESLTSARAFSTAFSVSAGRLSNFCSRVIISCSLTTPSSICTHNLHMTKFSLYRHRHSLFQTEWVKAFRPSRHKSRSSQICSFRRVILYGSKKLNRTQEKQKCTKHKDATSNFTMGNCVTTTVVAIYSLVHTLNTYGRRAFSVAGPTVWNSLPDFIRDPTISADCFRRLLKTYLFAQY